MDLEHVVAQYMNHIEHGQKVARSTVKSYSHWLKQYRKWVIQEDIPYDTDTLTTDNLCRFLYSLSERGLRPRTIRSAMHPFRGLCRLLVQHGVFDSDPTQKIPVPKKDAAIRHLISDEEIMALLGAVERIHRPVRRALARGLLCCLVFTGVRFTELLDLRLRDVKLDAGTLLVADGKGSKSRLLYPPDECLDALRQWLTFRGECEEDWLWVQYRRHRYVEDSIRGLLEEVKCIAGLADHGNIKPHSIRHWFATHMMENGAPITAISAALGHSCTATTFIYLHYTEAQTKQMPKYAALPQRGIKKPQTEDGTAHGADNQAAQAKPIPELVPETPSPRRLLRVSVGDRYTRGRSLWQSG